MNTDKSEAGSFGSMIQSECHSLEIDYRTSARPSKKMKQDSLVHSQVVDDTVIEQKEVGHEDMEIENTTLKRNTRRTSWIPQDKDTFFEALNACGKDFDEMQNYFVQKTKQIGTGSVKSRSQIKCFYYHTWSKLSRHLRFPPDMKIQVQELYGLINYGELRKIVGFVNKKIFSKLNELIYLGFTCMRVKGKNIHLRTPNCPSLKNINILEDFHDFCLPENVSIDLTPKNNLAWVKIQAMSQNPRIRISLPLQYRLSNLIQFLEKKWKMNSPIFQRAFLHSNIIKRNSLRLAPKPHLRIRIPDLNIECSSNNNRISLISYAEKLGSRDSCKEILNQIQIEYENKETRRRLYSNSATYEEEEENMDDVMEPEELVKKSLDCEEQELHYGEDDDDDDIPEFLQKLKKIQSKDEAVATVKSGWNLRESESVSIGDLYLMFGCESKIQLDYLFEEDPSSLRTTTDSSATHVSENVAQPALMINALKSIINSYKAEKKNLSFENRNRLELKESSAMPQATTSTSTTGENNLFKIPHPPRKPSTSRSRLYSQTFNHLSKIMPRHSYRRGRTPAPVYRPTVTQRPSLPQNDQNLMTFNLIPGRFLPVKIMTTTLATQGQMPNMTVSHSANAEGQTTNSFAYSPFGFPHYSRGSPTFSPIPTLSTLLDMNQHGPSPFSGATISSPMNQVAISLVPGFILKKED